MADTTTLDNICYKANFLTGVVARIDFLSPISQLTEEMPSTIASAVREYFPIAEPREMVAQQLQLAKGELTTAEKKRFTEWNFYGKDRKKRLGIAPDWLFVEYSAYTRYEDLRAEFTSVLTPFLQQFRDCPAKRIGLRYVNQLPLPGTSPLKWADYVVPNLLALLDFYQPDELCRAFHLLEFSYDDLRLRFQFGLHNPDYPARIRRSPFVLDLDAFSDSPVDSGAIGEQLDKFHRKIQDLFEASITDALRGRLNA